MKTIKTTMTMNAKKIVLMSSMFLLLFACKDDKDDSVTPGPGQIISPNDEEVITTVQLIFSDTMNTPIDTFQFRDLDGPGGLAPSIDSIKLQGNTKYLVQVMLLDESNPNDVEDISAEVNAEADEHLMCYFPNNTNALSIVATDTDGTFPIGLLTRWETNANGMTSMGTIQVVLKHQVGTKDGTCAPGSTDIDVTFPCDC